MVKAGPGTGKTHTLIEWLARQIKENDVPSEITAVTFTIKAADEINDRLRNRVGPQAESISTGTFHALCWRWLQEQFPHLTTVYDASNRKMTLRILFPNLSKTDRNRLFEQLTDFLEFDKDIEPRFHDQITTYREHLWDQGAVDISDLIHRTIEELKSNNQWLSRLRNRCKVLAVDEFQDINSMQYQLVHLLGKGQNLLAIGDADQAIYGFRGSNVSLFFRFEDDFNARSISLKQNYRSTDSILNGASSLINHNNQSTNNKLIAQKKSQHHIASVEADNPYREADYILDQINRYVGGTESLTTGKHTNSEYSYSFGDIAILFRTNSVGEALFKSLLKSGIPVHFGDGTSFLNEPPFTIIGNILRLVQQPDDRLILSNILKEVYEWNQKQITSFLQSLTKFHTTLFGETLKETISQPLQEDLTDLSNIYKKAAELIDSNQQLFDAVTTICDHFIEDDKLSKSQQLKKETLLELSAESAGEISRFLKQLQLNPYADVGRLKKQAVHLLTFHAAKGLEFPIVFIAAAEEGVTPILREDTDFEEERRLFYVAMTRAEDELQIVHSKERWRFGEKESMKPSRFIDEISEDYIKRQSIIENSSDDEQNEDEQLGLF